MIAIPHRDNWDITQLQSICDFQNGHAFKNSEYQNSTDNSYIVFRMGNIEKGGGLKQDPSNSFISRDKCRSLSRYVLNKGDIVMSMTDMKASMALLGHTALIDENDKYILNQRVGRITVTRPDIIDHEFLYYYTNSAAFISHLRGVAHSGVQVNLSTKAIKESPVVVPPLPTQKKVAAILSAYDELVENNNRRIQILDEMARLIYREWFVNYCFPGHESIKMVDSSLGKIPEGWTICQIGSKFTAVLGGTPSRSQPEYWTNGSIPWINSGKANELRVIEASELITDKALRKSATKMMPARTTLVAITGATLGQVSLLEIDACANQSVVGIYDKVSLFSEWIYLTFSHRIYEIIQHASGGAQQHINKEIIEKVIIPLPTTAIISAFNEIIKPIFDSIANLIRKNFNLRSTRDLLLPKLISGEIDVSELDIDIGDDAA